MLKEFVRLYCRWFGIVLVLSFVGLIVITGRKYNSLIEILMFSAIGSLVVTMVISFVSIPVVAVIVKQKNRKVQTVFKSQHPVNGRQCSDFIGGIN